MKPDFTIVENISAMNMIISNIITNAADSIKTAGRITISAGKENGLYRIEIADNGKGIAPADMARLFDFDYTTKAQGKGTGFGLFLVKELSDRYGIKINIESALAGGTKFIIKGASE